MLLLLPCFISVGSNHVEMGTPDGCRIHELSDLLPPHQSSIASTDDNSTFAPVVVNVQVRYPDDEPMSDVMVVAINHEYYFRCNEKTNASGWVTLRAMGGNWSFFAYPGRLIQKGIGYFPCVLNRSLTNPTEEVILKPETEVHIELVSSINELSDLDLTEISLTESNFGFLASVSIAGQTNQGNLTLYTQSNVTARISLHKMAQQNQPGIVFVSEPVRLEGHIIVNITKSNTGKLRLEFRDIHGNLSSGAHVQIHVLERSWQWSPYIVDYSLSNLTFIVSAGSFWVFCGVDVFETKYSNNHYRMLFDSKYFRSVVQNETVFKFGGQISYRVLVTPKAAKDFKPATQIMLYATDASKNVVAEVDRFGEPSLLKPHLVITTDAGKEVDTDIQGALQGYVRREFEPSENPIYTITCDFGPFGNITCEDSLYNPSVTKMIVYETSRLIAQSPAIDNDVRMQEVDSYETLFNAMEELIGVPTDYKIGIISNIAYYGFEDEILHGFKLELPYEIRNPVGWPLGDGFIAHEMGHGRINKPPANYRLWEEAYATLIGEKARARLFGDDRLFDFLMGGHDLFLKHQHGDPVQTWYDQIEIIQFITYYIDKNYGWQAHRSMILEWENAFVPIRNILSSNGFSEIEQMATVYSYLVGENLAWLFKLGSFDVTKDKVNAGINLIMQDQQESGNDEFKIGETTAITYTASVPIMLRRVPSSLSKINMTLTFDQKSAKILSVFKRDLTSNQKWKLSTTSDAFGHLTILLEGSENITKPGSVAQVNFELVPSNRSELQITVLNASTDSKRNAAAEGGKIVTDQLSVVRPKELPFEVIWNETTYFITMSSNSTIKNFHLDQANRTLSFNVTAPIGTLGFCNVTIPKQLLNTSAKEWIVLVDNEPVDPIVTWNTTHTFLFFTYVHSTHEITIIPEFSLLVMLLSMITILLAVIVCRRKQSIANRR